MVVGLLLYADVQELGRQLETFRWSLLPLVALGRGTAGTATLLIRFCTLWFGVSLGMTVLVLFRRRLLPSLGREAAPPRGR